MGHNIHSVFVTSIHLTVSHERGTPNETKRNSQEAV